MHEEWRGTDSILGAVLVPSGDKWFSVYTARSVKQQHLFGRHSSCCDCLHRTELAVIVQDIYEQNSQKIHPLFSTGLDE